MAALGVFVMIKKENGATPAKRSRGRASLWVLLAVVSVLGWTAVPLLVLGLIGKTPGDGDSAGGGPVLLVLAILCALAAPGLAVLWAFGSCRRRHRR
ncbi:hypothetical protein LX15_003785 [Streptoalloteichus tenebrarius]|uniref:Integral membrane protein n=1 Tax=Streptoalloteichus tenebrarius (strain ATCC 17920 / DSM 40477 / JCM 4838 / CBS 697.72 / NBRC 16177 / NCIMB 11028 / NRRL B-12390 / A12253. 1 / ISP 5477) TaxID=1933 RepID=A0ABT1HX43_STRSD|nr:hypothetical protein [Streptoalloteichus tenebrarius]MCP2260074.1 hypothetical protein [Streptoalloteichus tenebrarius]BFF00607.1 hypothetical protein GCM10020241_22820 [Streptoalloteichus tenebrarius]